MAGEHQGSEEDFLSSPVAPALPPAINTHQFALLRNKLGAERNPEQFFPGEQREPTPLQQQSTARAGNRKASANPPHERAPQSYKDHKRATTIQMEFVPMTRKGAGLLPSSHQRPEGQHQQQIRTPPRTDGDPSVGALATARAQQGAGRDSAWSRVSCSSSWQSCPGTTVLHFCQGQN